MTTQTLDLQNLNLRMSQLEKQVAHLKRELQQLQNTPQPTTAKSKAPTPLAMDKKIVRQRFAALQIKHQPLSIADLRQKMTELNLAPNELSAGIIAMREE
jgi:hypothetical protein